MHNVDSIVLTHSGGDFRKRGTIGTDMGSTAADINDWLCERGRTIILDMRRAILQLDPCKAYLRASYFREDAVHIIYRSSLTQRLIKAYMFGWDGVHKCTLDAWSIYCFIVLQLCQPMEPIPYTYVLVVHHYLRQYFSGIYREASTKKHHSSLRRDTIL